MKPERKREVIELVRRSPMEKKQTLVSLPKSPSAIFDDTKLLGILTRD
jgi:hypothetical protein